METEEWETCQSYTPPSESLQYTKLLVVAAATSAQSGWKAATTYEQVETESGERLPSFHLFRLQVEKPISLRQH